MRPLLLTLAIATGTMLLLAPIASAQSPINIPDIADHLATVDSNALSTSLQQPMANDALPAGFADAIPADSGDALSPSKFPEDQQPVAMVSYSLTYAPGGGATPEAGATPPSGGPERIYNNAAIYYLLFDETQDPEDMDRVDAILRTVVGDLAAGEETRQITIADTTANLISIETELNGVPLMMDWIAVPVGNVLVISMTMAGGEAADSPQAQADAEALVSAAITHLGSAAENATTPAG